MNPDESTALGNAVSTLFIAGAIIAVAVILVLGLLRAGKLPPSVALVISLSLLTLVAMVGFIATINDSNSAELATLAGTGLGALAGAVTAVWGTDNQWKEKQMEEKSTKPEEVKLTSDEWEAENPHLPPTSEESE